MMDDSGDLTIGTESASRVPAPFVRSSCRTRDEVRCEACQQRRTRRGLSVAVDQLAAMERTGRAGPTSASRPASNFWAEAPRPIRPDRRPCGRRACATYMGFSIRSFWPPISSPRSSARSPGAIEEAGRSRGNAHDDPEFRSSSDSRISTSWSRPSWPTMSGHPPLRDAEGDVAIRVGSTMLFLRTAADGEEVIIFAAVVHDVAGRSRATEVLNDLNVEAAG